MAFHGMTIVKMIMTGHDGDKDQIGRASFFDSIPFPMIDADGSLTKKGYSSGLTTWQLFVKISSKSPRSLDDLLRLVSTK